MKNIAGLRMELERKGLKEKEIQKYLEVVLYIYIGQNIRNEGILIG